MAFVSMLSKFGSPVLDHVENLKAEFLVPLNYD